MTKVQFRRWVVKAIELAIFVTILFFICVLVCIVMGLGLKLLGVA